MREFYPYDPEVHLEVIQDQVLPFPVTPGLDSYLGKLLKKDMPPPIELQRLAEQSETTDQREHTWGLRRGPDNVPDNSWAIGDWVELARIRAHKDFITTIRKIDTTVTLLDGEPITFREKPFLNPVVRFYLWYCDINTPNNQLLDFRPGPDQFARPTGNPVFQLPRFPDHRYVWGNPGNVVTIPLIQNYMCVLFAQIVNPTVPDPGGGTIEYPNWSAGVQYSIGDIVQYPSGSGTLYICIQAHTSIVTWEPPNVPALWQPYEQQEPPVIDVEIAVGGRLVASTQSENSIAAEWQAKRTFHV